MSYFRAIVDRILTSLAIYQFKMAIEIYAKRKKREKNTDLYTSHRLMYAMILIVIM